MKKVTQFVAEDGTVFENKKDCQIYELSLENKVFKAKEDLDTFIESLVKKIPHSIGFLELWEVAENIAQDYSDVYLETRKISLRDCIFNSLSLDAVKNEFTEFLELPDEKVKKLYNKAYERGHSSGVQEVYY
jgi:hypothetical protein